MELNSVCPMGILNSDRRALAADVSNSEMGSVKVYCKSNGAAVRDCILGCDSSGGGTVVVVRREGLDGVISAAARQFTQLQELCVWLGVACG